MAASDPGEIDRLVSLARSGDRAAFDGLVRMHRERLLCLIHLRLGPKLREKLETEDVEQETYVRALQAIRRFEPSGPTAFFRWLSEIAVNAIRDLARYHGSRPLLVPGSPTDSGVLPISPVAMDPTPSKILRRNERFERLETALSQLPDDYREVILLTQIQGVPIGDVAERLGRSRDAVSMLLLRALRKLRRLFGTTDSLRLPARSISEGPDGASPHPTSSPPA